MRPGLSASVGVHVAHSFSRLVIMTRSRTLALPSPWGCASCSASHAVLIARVYRSSPKFHST